MNRSASSPSRGPGRAGALAEFLRQEATGGRLLLIATVVALVWANLAPGGYDQVWGWRVGPGALHLDLQLSEWVADGLLAVFFFVAGLEVKRELTVGELAGVRAAALPFLAAAGGMLVPALITLAVSRGAAAEGGAWAIPTATDIAFALGILAVAGSSVPSGARVVLLSLAVIDDLGAIALIAILFTHGLAWAWLAGGIALCAIYWAAHRIGWTPWWAMLPLAIATWVCVHSSGVHATVAGVLLGLLTPVVARAGQDRSPAERLEHRLHPLSAGLVVPLFALAAAGVPLTGLTSAAADPLAQGVFTGLLVGKTIGIFGGAWLAVRLRLAVLPEGVGWPDVLPIAVLGGIGYTVSLLVTELSTTAPAADHAAAAVLSASFTASLLALLLLRLRRGR